ncbi:MAG: hypothetical protein R6W75_11380 [Smithellaceae bacterium]
MKSWILRAGLVVLVFASVAGVAWMSSSGLRTPYQDYSFIKMPPLVEHFVPGELVAGRTVEQRLVLAPEVLALSIPPESNFCVGVLVATYHDRQNDGYLRFSVFLPDGHSLSANASFSEMKDNRYHKICFDYPFEKLLPGEYLVRLESREGKPGSSGTLWLTKHDQPPFSSWAVVDGKEVDGAVVMGFLARDKATMPVFSVLMLAGLYAAMIFVLLLALFTRTKDEER